MRVNYISLLPEKYVLLMISRRLLRIKALSVLYACNRKELDDLETAEQELMLSIKKSYDLFHYLLLLLIDLSDLARERVILSKRKNIQTPEDINPNTRFAENRVIKQLRDNDQLKRYTKAMPSLWTRKDKITNFRALNKYLDSLGLSWGQYPEATRAVFNEMTGWSVYHDYMSSADDSYKADLRFVKELVTQLFPASSELETILEEQSVYWNDDLPFVTAMIRNTIGKFSESDDGHYTLLPPMFTNSDDERYAKVLLRKAILNSDRNSDLIDKHTTNWEVERIALMDKLVMHLAVTEITEFPEVPVKVTLNEYIEIAKDYSTDKSSTFVNGILDKIVREMRANSSFAKSGRGLIGEPVAGEGTEHRARGKGQRAKGRGPLNEQSPESPASATSQGILQAQKPKKKRIKKKE